MKFKRQLPKAGPRVQGGAVLYVALIMLILLALIGIVGMQVAGMQERMAANYRAVNVAFQNAEGELRTTECTIADFENRTATPGCTAIAAAEIESRCEDGFNVQQWLATQNLGSAPAYSVRRIDECTGDSASAMGVGPVSESPLKTYRITVYSADSISNRSSAAAIDAVFKP